MALTKVPNTMLSDLDGGGAIDDTSIGTTTPAAGSFTTLSANSTVDFSSATLARTDLPGNVLSTEAGSGITGGSNTVYASSVTLEGGIYKTSILIDLTDLNSGDSAGDIIGVDGTANPCHIGQIAAATNGTIIAGTMTCLEVPAGGDDDIDLYAADESTGVEDSAIADLTETQLVNAGAHTLGLVSVLTAFPSDTQYLYLVNQGTSDATYTAGKFLIELYGTA